MKNFKNIQLISAFVGATSFATMILSDQKKQIVAEENEYNKYRNISKIASSGMAISLVFFFISSLAILNKNNKE